MSKPVQVNLIGAKNGAVDVNRRKIWTRMYDQLAQDFGKAEARRLIVADLRKMEPDAYDFIRSGIVDQVGEERTDAVMHILVPIFLTTRNPDARMKTPTIKAELIELLSSGDAGLSPYVEMPPGTPENKWSGLNNNKAWSALHLWRDGVRVEEACARAPKTAKIVEKFPLVGIPNRTPTVFFSILEAGKHIPPHTGVTNTRAIIHLPLIVPPGCAFRVGGETREWREGEAFAFDDTIEHEAWNRSDQDRAVLILDCWNPHLSDHERAMICRMFSIADEQKKA